MAIFKSGQGYASTTEGGLLALATAAEHLAGLNSSKAATPAGVRAMLDQLIDGAPGLLDSLNELAAAIGDDANFSVTVNNQITNLQDQINSLSGGGASNQAEVDRIEAGVGLGSTGLYVARSGTNYIDSASTIAAEIGLLDTQIKSNQDVSTALNVRLTTAESEVDTLQTESTDYESRISSLEAGGSLGALQSELDASQASVGLNANGTLGTYANTNFYSASATIKEAIEGVDAQAKLNDDDITSQGNRITVLEAGGSISALQSEVDASQAAVGLSASGAYVSRSGSNYLDSASTIVAEIGLLDAQVDTNEQDIATINTTISTLTSEGDSNGDAIDALQIELDATQAGAGLSNLGSYSAPGASNYLTSASTLKAADSLLDTQIKVNADAIALKASTSSVSANTSSISTNTSNISTNASDISAAEVDIAANTSAIAGKAASSTTTAIQTEVDAIESSVGLGSSGGLNYSGTPALFSASATLTAAIQALDGEIVTNAGDILGNANQITAQIALNNTQEAAIGLSTSGTYVSRSGTNFLDSASSIVGEITALDTAVQANVSSLATKATAVQLSALDLRVTNAESGLSSNDTEIQALEDLADTHETNIGLDNDGGYTAISGANYATSGVSIKAAITQLDTQLKTTQDEVDAEETARASGDSANAAAINTVEASVGLAANGSLSISGTNFLNSSSTIVGALSTLDTNQKLLSDIRTNMIASLGLSTTGEKNNYANTNFIDNAEDVIEAIEALDRQVKTNETDISSVSGGSISALQTEVDAIETAAGLASGGTYVAHSGSNFMDAASTMKGAREALDARLKTAVDDLDTAEAAIVSNDTDITALQTRATSLEQRCGGMFKNDTSTTSAVMDSSPIIRGHAGPFAYNLGQSYLDGFGAGGFGFDFIFYGTSAEKCSDIHFDVQSDGDAVFTGIVSGLNI